MTTFFGLTMAFCLLWSFWKRKHNSYAELVFRTQLFELRDELRRLAIDGKVDAENQLFDYYDYSLSKTIEMSHSLTLFYVITFKIRAESDDNYIEASNRVSEMITEQNDSNLNGIRERWVTAMAEYVSEQHKISFGILVAIFRPLGMLRGMSNAFRKGIDSIVISPALSLKY